MLPSVRAEHEAGARIRAHRDAFDAQWRHLGLGSRERPAVVMTLICLLSGSMTASKGATSCSK
jgi:hypothetical protein